MNRLRQRLLLIGLPLFAALIWLVPGSASAAIPNSAQCFKLGGSIAQTRSLNCSELIGLPKPGGGTINEAFFRANTCYLAGWGVASAPADSNDCRRWRGLSGGGDEEREGSNQGGAGGASNGNAATPAGTRISQCDGSTECINQNPLVVLLKTLINILSGAVGVVIVAVIVMAGIQFSTSGGNPQAAANAKKRIANAVIALVAYMLLWVLFQWLIPGGLL